MSSDRSPGALAESRKVATPPRDPTWYRIKDK
jgi:hypothetical protein